MQPFVVFPKILEALKAAGFEVEFRGPGVVDIRGEDIALIHIVNFLNPFVGGPGELGKEAVDTAIPLQGTSLQVVDLPHLIALKRRGAREEIPHRRGVESGPRPSTETVIGLSVSLVHPRFPPHVPERVTPSSVRLQSVRSSRRSKPRFANGMARIV